MVCSTCLSGLLRRLRLAVIDRHVSLLNAKNGLSANMVISWHPPLSKGITGKDVALGTLMLGTLMLLMNIHFPLQLRRSTACMACVLASLGSAVLLRLRLTIAIAPYTLGSHYRVCTSPASRLPLFR